MKITTTLHPNSTDSEITAVQSGVRNLFYKAKERKKTLIVSIKEDKTSRQLRGFHRLCGLIADFISESGGIACDKEMAKEYIKKQYGFISRYKGLDVCKSCKNASMEEMKDLIKTAEIFGAENGIEDCYLLPYEQQDFEKYYNVRK